MGRYGGGKNAKAAKAKKEKTAAPVQPVPEPTPEQERDEGRQKLLERLSAIEAEARARGYYANHTVCSAVAYLMGVPEPFFLPEQPLAALHHEVYDQLQKQPDLVVVRQLCMLRCVIMRRFSDLVANNREKRMTFSECLDSFDEMKTNQKVFDILYRAGCDIGKLNEKGDLNEYLLRINERVKRYVDRAALLPQLAGVDFNLIRSALLYPGWVKLENVKDVSTQYNNDRRRNPVTKRPGVYPFAWYINLDFSESSGNIMAEDDRFVEFLYKNADRTPPELAKFRTRITDTTENELRRFLVKRGNYQYRPFVDGSTTRVETVLPLLRALHEINDDQIAPMVLYCPRSAEDAWHRCLQKSPAGGQVELILPDAQSGSREWSTKLAADTALRLELAPENTSLLLIGPSDHYLEALAENEVLDAARAALSRVLLAGDPSNQMAARLERLGLKQLYIDDLVKPDILPDTEADREELARQALERRFPIPLGSEATSNLFTIVDEALDNLPFTYTQAERVTWRNELRRRLTVQVDPKGRMRVALQPAS